MTIKKICLFLLAGILFAHGINSIAAQRWSEEKINNWQKEHGWLTGVNYIPSDAINYTAMWDKTSFNPELIDKELAIAESIGFNCVRVVLQHAVYADDPAYFLNTFDKFLSICEKHNIKATPTFFDDCVFGTNNVPVVGKQDEPKIGWYAWAWSPSPGHTIVRDPNKLPMLEKYVKDVLQKFKNDKRIAVWDLYNEPTNSGMGKASYPLLKNVFQWAREIEPSQPITVGAWNNDKELNKIITKNSDLISFHCYGDKSKMKEQIAKWKQFNRPVICTEWMNRPKKSTVEDVMPTLKSENVGSFIWGLINGKTQTHLPWGYRPEHLPYNGPWQHDLYKNDFTPYNQKEIDLIKELCLKTPLLDGQWSVEQANDWYAKQQWIVGCNFLPSTAINDVEMWQDETFDLPTIDKELALAKEWGINSVRVFLNYVVWEAEAEKFKSNFKKFLDVAEKHGISVMPILFDDCNFSGNVAKVGKQQEPVPSVHNSGWVSSPPVTMVRDESQWNKLKAYEQDMIRTFGSDKRIIIWDLYNEPSNSDSRIKPQLLKNIFAWAREVKPSQPLTVGAFNNFSGELSKLMRSHSDVVSFHCYSAKSDFEQKIKWAKEAGRPVICTEWLNRPSKNTVADILSLLKETKTGGYLWGLVNGKTQTHVQWGSTPEKPKVDIWQHDLMYNNGAVYDASELRIFKSITGK